MRSIRQVLSRRPARESAARSPLKARPTLESLESRMVMTATTNAWPHPQLITISFMPDGTDLGGVGSNLQSTFNSKPGLSGRWQGVILKAAQAWAQVTNI